jgi:hypothetical protein
MTAEDDEKREKLLKLSPTEFMVARERMLLSDDESDPELEDDVRKASNAEYQRLKAKALGREDG